MNKKKITIITSFVAIILIFIAAFSYKNIKTEKVNDDSDIIEDEEDELVHITVPAYFDLTEILSEDDQYLIEDIKIKENEDGTFDYGMDETLQTSIKYSIDKNLFNIINNDFNEIKYESYSLSKDRSILEFYVNSNEYNKDTELNINEENYIEMMKNYNIMNETEENEFIYYIIDKETDDILYGNHPEHTIRIDNSGSEESEIVDLIFNR